MVNINNIDKFVAYFFLATGLFFLLPLLGIWEPEDYLIPGIILSTTGFAMALSYLGKHRLFLLASATGFFFSGIAMIVNSAVIIRHYDLFLSFSFFFTLAVIFLILYWEDNFHLLYLILFGLTVFIGFMLLSFLPSEFIFTLGNSIHNTLVLLPFILIFAGYVILHD